MTRAGRLGQVALWDTYLPPLMEEYVFLSRREAVKREVLGVGVDVQGLWATQLLGATKLYLWII